MSFQFSTFKEDEYRTYTLSMWPRSGEEITTKGGIIDRENDVRLIYYGNGAYRSPSNEYQFIFDFKGISMNINISQKAEDNDLYCSLLEIKGNDGIDTEEFMPFLREAVVLFWQRQYSISDKSLIHILF